MLSKCIKMPKYSFKRNLFFAIWGGVYDWFWPTHHTSHAVHWPHHDIVLAAPRVMSATPHIMSAIQSMTINIWSTSSSTFFQVFWYFLGWNFFFFQNCSKFPKNHFRTIKKFFPTFSAITRVGGSNQIWRLQIVFNPSLKGSASIYLSRNLVSVKWPTRISIFFSKTQNIH